MVIMLIAHGDVNSDGLPFRVETREVGNMNPAAFDPPQGTNAYSFYWDHDVSIRTADGMAGTRITSPIGPLFSRSKDWPTRETIRHNANCPSLLGSDPRPHSFLFAERNGRKVVVREMQTSRPTTPAA